MTCTSSRWRVCAGFSILLAVLVLLAAYPLGFLLPERWGYENQPVENLQVVLLLIGMVTALVFLRKGDEPGRWLGLAAAPIWLVLAGRELSWGAVFVDPTSLTDHGPLFSSRFLWYKAAVAPSVAALILICVAIVVWKRLAPLALRMLIRNHMPLLALAVVAAGMVMSAGFEGHVGFEVTIDLGAAQLIEETAELAAYLALLASQFYTFAYLGRPDKSDG